MAKPMKVQSVRYDKGPSQMKLGPSEKSKIPREPTDSVKSEKARKASLKKQREKINRK